MKKTEIRWLKEEKDVQVVEEAIGKTRKMRIMKTIINRIRRIRIAGRRWGTTQS